MMIELRDVQDPNVTLRIDDGSDLDQDLIAISLTARRGYGWFNREELVRTLIALGEKEID